MKIGFDMLISIFIIVSISISTALILDYIQNLNLYFFNIYVILGFVFVLGLNILKFIVWNFLHKKYDLSSAYPMTAIYFPMIYIISVYKKEITIDLLSLFAIAFIFIGVYLIFNADKKKETIV